MDDNSNKIYFCQVSEKVSCGACCGLYNLPELSQQKLETLLALRTKEFALVERSEEAIFQFQKRNKGPHRLSRPFAQFHHCPFLGLIGEKKSRVGCLLHPATPGNNSVDFRSLSWYGEQACSTYFCPSTNKLPSVYKTILIQVIDNWYDFGLIVTEHALIISYFEEVEFRIGRPVEVFDYAQNFDAIESLREFARLKSNWPYRRENSPGPCNFLFENGMYQRPGVFRNSPDIPLSRYEEIFIELDSGFSSQKEMFAAEQLLDKLFARAEKAISISAVS